MFTRTLDGVLGSRLVDLLAGPYGIDRYTELVSPTWTPSEARAKVIAVSRDTPRSVTLTLAPNAAFPRRFPPLRAGQHVVVDIDIDGRRRSRCYSPANAEGRRHIELTVSHHDGGLVSTYLCRHARPGLVVGLTGVGGEFVLPATRPRRILLVSGGSGITPVLAMLRTLVAEGHTGEIAFVHYARNPVEAAYRDELAALAARPGVRVLHGYPRAAGCGDLVGYFGADHLQAALRNPDAVYVCGPPALVAAVRAHCPAALAESFAPPVAAAPAGSGGGQLRFTGSGVTVRDDGRSLLEQAESAGLQPVSGCRMGICHSCTCRKTHGAVRNLVTGTMSTDDDEDIQICVSAPVGDVDLAL